MVAATLRVEWCLPLHVCINKMSAIPKQKGLHTAALKISLGATCAACASGYKHLHCNIRRSVAAAQDTIEMALVHGTQNPTGDQPRAAGGPHL